MRVGRLMDRRVTNSLETDTYYSAEHAQAPSFYANTKGRLKAGPSGSATGDPERSKRVR